eukprot:15769183-Heterocapsa_arctica.AAC.1
MNEKPDPTEEERMGGSGHVGNIILSAGDDCEQWLKKGVNLIPDCKMMVIAKDICIANIMWNSDENAYLFKVSGLKVERVQILTANYCQKVGSTDLMAGDA